MRDFRLLRPHEIECRISEIPKKGNGLFLLLYKTARTDAALLDETYGAANWQNDYRVLDGKMYCGIGVKHGDEWVWKWNVGTESNTEAEKGEASDAMKRAGFVLGLGTELYSSPRIWVGSDKCTIQDVNGKWKCYDTFSVKEVDYDANEDISRLVIVNDKTGGVAFSFGGKAPAPVPAPKAPSDIAFRCTDCKEVITPWLTADNKTKMSVRQIAQASKAEYGRELCLRCINKARAERGNAT